MRYVYCPFCDNIQEQVGFRPMTFNCLRCGAEGNWYNGREAYGIDRGFIAWSMTASTVEYWTQIVSSYAKIAESLIVAWYKFALKTYKFSSTVLERITVAIIEETLKPEPDPIEIARLQALLTLCVSVISLLKGQITKYLKKLEQLFQALTTIPFAMLLEIQAEVFDELSGESPGDVQENFAEMVLQALSNANSALNGKLLEATAVIGAFYATLQGISTQI